MNVDEQIGVEAVHASLHTTEEFREMFRGAIQMQRDIIKQAESTIGHYEYALSEMARHTEDLGVTA